MWSIFAGIRHQDKHWCVPQNGAALKTRKGWSWYFRFIPLVYKYRTNHYHDHHGKRYNQVMHRNVISKLTSYDPGVLYDISYFSTVASSRSLSANPTFAPAMLEKVRKPSFHQRHLTLEYPRMGASYLRYLLTISLIKSKSQQRHFIMLRKQCCRCKSEISLWLSR